MKITKSQFRKVIKEALRKAINERGFGEGKPAKDELSKKREVYLEEEVEAGDYSVEKLSNKLIRIRKI